MKKLFFSSCWWYKQQTVFFVETSLFHFSQQFSPCQQRSHYKKKFLQVFKISLASGNITKIHSLINSRRFNLFRKFVEFIIRKKEFKMKSTLEFRMKRTKKNVEISEEIFISCSIVWIKTVLKLQWRNKLMIFWKTKLYGKTIVL